MTAWACSALLCHVEEFRYGVLDVVNPAAEENVAVVMARLVEKGLGLSKPWRLPLGFFRVVKQLLCVEDSLIGLLPVSHPEPFKMQAAISKKGESE